VDNVRAGDFWTKGWNGGNAGKRSCAVKLKNEANRNPLQRMCTCETFMPHIKSDVFFSGATFVLRNYRVG